MKHILRPFFSFYGGKWRDALKHYPAPNRDTIVEPFAGSAGYSTRYASARIQLFDIDPIIVGVWDYLIHVSELEFGRLPNVQPQQSVDDLNIPQEARWLIGFWMNKGTSSPRKTPSAWMRSGIRPGSFWGNRVRLTIKNQLASIRHWKIKQSDYQTIERIDATWFVDPPYQDAGKHYRFGANRIDFAKLGQWCQVLPGQVIVCENEGATWLPFVNIASTKTARKGHRSKEAYWLNDSAITPR
ncbi:MAG: hypothetical protein E6Q97_06195 [Desulfurellales bacterium]|nr:MAG: hypothetical protein E6Q97_06195 [Desulfurellales bacterium]